VATREISVPAPKAGDWSFSRVNDDDGLFAYHRALGVSGFDLHLKYQRSEGGETPIEVEFRSPLIGVWQRADVVLVHAGDWAYEPTALALCAPGSECDDETLQRMAEGLRAFVRESSSGQSDFQSLAVEQ